MTTQRLFVLDLNGTLLHRLTKSQAVTTAKRHPKYRPADCVVNGNPIHFRPFHTELLRGLLECGDVAVWTSAMPKNAIPMAMHTFKGLIDVVDDLPCPGELVACHHTQSRKLNFLWTQDECGITRTMGERKPKFRKDLEKIWSQHSAFNASNTIMIDDSAEKLQDHLENLLCIPEFVVTDAEVNFTEDKVLRHLLTYIESMTKANPPDVREYLKSHRFDAGESPEALLDEALGALSI